MNINNIWNHHPVFVSTNFFCFAELTAKRHQLPPPAARSGRRPRCLVKRVCVDGIHALVRRYPTDPAKLGKGRTLLITYTCNTQLILVNLLREKNRLTEKRENSLWHTLAGTLLPNAWEIANQKEWWFQTENLKYDRDVILRVRSRRTSADSTIQRKHNQQTGTSFFQVTRTHHLKWRSLF